MDLYNMGSAAYLLIEVRVWFMSSWHKRFGAAVAYLALYVCGLRTALNHEI